MLSLKTFVECIFGSCYFNKNIKNNDLTMVLCPVKQNIKSVI